MKTKTFAVIMVITFIIVFGLNGIFHTILAAGFFDTNLDSIQGIKKMSESNPAPVALLDFILVFTMTFIITRNMRSKINRAEGALTGGIINLVSSSAWNLANSSLFNWPVIVSIADIAWHVFLGCMGGILITILFNKTIKGTITNNPYIAANK